jgi:hypothetical protein
MRIFSCQKCQQVLFFENVQCTKCGQMLAYLPDRATMAALEREAAPAQSEPSADVAAAPVFVTIEASRRPGRYRLCGNYLEHGVCNWAIPADDHHQLCHACRLNAVIPNLSDASAKAAWQRMEIAKRRLLYTLMELELPIEPKTEENRGLAFSFKQDEQGGQVRVFTGHADGLITINIAEADDPSRERMRQQMGEAYRTLLGHFRHEVGHYYWDRLIRDTDWHERYRALFGDESADYSEAQQRHYADGPPADWALSFISPYATMHPWEDWAETFAHYLHMIDTLETAGSYGMVLRPKPVGGAKLDETSTRKLHFDDFDEVIAVWFPLTVALNSLNRGMGLPDLYPFVLCERAIEKLRFVHELIENGSWRSAAATQPPAALPANNPGAAQAVAPATPTPTPMATG